MDPNNQLQFDLLEIIKTKEDRLYFLTQLDILSHSFFSNEKDVMDLLEKNLPYGKKETLLQIAKTYKVEIIQEHAFHAFMELVKKIVSQMPEIAITLSFWPSQEIVNAISSWFALHIKQAVLLDISVDKTIIGGAIIGYQGKYKDYSLRKKLQEKYGSGEIKLLIK